MTLLLLALLQVDPIENASKKANDSVKKAVEELDGQREALFKAAVAGVGAKLPDRAKIRLHLVDAIDPDATMIAVHDGTGMVTRSTGPREATIDIYSEYLINGMEPPLSTLRHEMVHAVMRLDLGDAYYELPKWLREGMAVHLSEQGPSRTLYYLMLARFVGDPEKLIDGLENARHTLSDYPEDCLGVDYFVSVAGKEALLKLEVKLRGGAKYREAIGELCGKSFDDFLSGAKEHALKAIRELVGRHQEAIEAYRAIIQAPLASKRLCEDFKKKFPQSPFLSPVLFYLARSSGDEGSALFGEFIESTRAGEGMSGLADDARFFRGQLLEKQGKKAEALAAYEDLATWHVYSSKFPDALYAWGILQIESDPDRARKILGRALASFPSHDSASRARRLLGD